MSTFQYNSFSSPDENRGPAILQVMWITAALAILVVAGRFYVRYAYLHRIKIEDWLMLTSLIFSVVSTSLNTVAVWRGLGRHKQSLTAHQIAEATKWSFIAQPIGIFATALGRLSVAYLLISILPPHRKGQRYFLYGIGYSHVLFTVGTVILVYAQCQPFNAYWDRALGKCISPKGRQYYGYFLGSYCSFIDLTLALFPIFIFWNLQLRLALKVFLCFIMGLGVVAMVASTVKTVELGIVARSKDSTFDSSYLLIWYALEMYLVIIAASIPTLKPVAMTRTKFSSSRSTDSGFSWRRLFKSKGSTNQSNTDDERKISSQLRSLQSNKRPCDIHATILRYEDSNLSESVTPRTETGLDGIKKKTEFTVGYVYKSPRVNQSQVRAQREFEMA